jgi:hypothetical protein
MAPLAVSRSSISPRLWSGLLQRSAEVLTDFGFTDEQVSTLVDRRVITERSLRKVD